MKLRSKQIESIIGWACFLGLVASGVVLVSVLLEALHPIFAAVGVFGIVASLLTGSYVSECCISWTKYDYLDRFNAYNSRDITPLITYAQAVAFIEQDAVVIERAGGKYIEGFRVLQAYELDSNYKKPKYGTPVRFSDEDYFKVCEYLSNHPWGRNKSTLEKRQAEILKTVDFLINRDKIDDTVIPRAIEVPYSQLEKYIKKDN